MNESVLFFAYVFAFHGKKTKFIQGQNSNMEEGVIKNGQKNLTSFMDSPFDDFVCILFS